MAKDHQTNNSCTCKNCTCKHGKHRGPLATISRIVCGVIFATTAILVLLNIFGIVTLSINVGILAALTALAIIAIYSALHLFWAGFFFVSATIVVIMNANCLVFNLSGSAIGNLYIAAALITVAFHIFFRRSTFGLHIGSHTEANFGSTVKNFEGEIDTASLECNFGQVKAYFENAKPKDGKATLNIECNFGSMELHVPKTWRVIDHTNTTFAGTEEKNHANLTDKSPVLTVEGEVNFGGLTIIYS